MVVRAEWVEMLHFSPCTGFSSAATIVAHVPTLFRAREKNAITHQASKMPPMFEITLSFL